MRSCFTLVTHFTIKRNSLFFCDLSLQFLYPLLPLFTGPIKGKEPLVKQSNKAVMECTTVSSHSLNAYSFSGSKSLFCPPIVHHHFFFIASSIIIVRYFSGVGASQDWAEVATGSAGQPGCIQRPGERMWARTIWTGALCSGAENRGCLWDTTMRQCQPDIRRIPLAASKGQIHQIASLKVWKHFSRWLNRQPSCRPAPVNFLVFLDLCLTLNIVVIYFSFTGRVELSQRMLTGY